MFAQDICFRFFIALEIREQTSYEANIENSMKINITDVLLVHGYYCNNRKQDDKKLNNSHLLRLLLKKVQYFVQIVTSKALVWRDCVYTCEESMEQNSLMAMEREIHYFMISVKDIVIELQFQLSCSWSHQYSLWWWVGDGMLQL